MYVNGLISGIKYMANSKLEDKTLVELSFPSMYNVLIHDDDITPIELVIFLLVECVELDNETAYFRANEAHEKGSAVVGVFTLHKAKEIVDNVKATAALNGFPEFSITYEEDKEDV